MASAASTRPRPRTITPSLGETRKKQKIFIVLEIFSPLPCFFGENMK